MEPHICPPGKILSKTGDTFEKEADWVPDSKNRIIDFLTIVPDAQTRIFDFQYQAYGSLIFREVCKKQNKALYKYLWGSPAMSEYAAVNWKAV